MEFKEQDELAEYLRGALQIRARKERAGYGSGLNDYNITIDLILNGDVISSDSVDITEGERQSYF